ncbi:DNA polymerase III subunit delta [Litorivicinus sp.]|nr:DNA polymerase III subunit delta [Litorivicinus sp.]MDC1240307.1 DNA polymerase III subunit delta [Litorivicinus sp.]
MAIKASEFDSHVWKDTLWPVTALLGDEPFFLTRIADSWRKLGRINGFSERIVIDQLETDPAGRLLNHLDTLSLFSDLSLVELRLHRGTIDSQLRKTLMTWITHPPEDKCLLVLGPNLGKGEQSAEWVKSLNQVEHLIEAARIPTYRFTRWLDDELARNHLILEAEAKVAITSHTEGNLLATGQVIERLKLTKTDCTKDSHISLDEIMGALTQSARYTVYDLVDCALNRDLSSINKIIDAFQSQGVDAMSALWAISRELDVLLQIRYRMDRGESDHEAISALRIWASRKKLVRSVVARLPLLHLRKLLTLCQDTDRAIKGASREPPWLMVKDLFMGLAGHPMGR